MAEHSESIISWNVPNFITIILMIGLVWVVAGIGSHFFRRGASNGKVTSGNLAGNGNVSGAEPGHISFGGP